MSNTAPTLTKAAGRRTHSLRGGQVCPCCLSLAPATDAANRLRRTQRRIERRTWKAEAREAIG